MNRGKRASSRAVGQSAGRRSSTEAPRVSCGRGLRLGFLFLPAAALFGCRVISLALPADAGSGDSALKSEVAGGALIDALDGSAIDAAVAAPYTGGPPDPAAGVGPAWKVGCSDGTREGFREVDNYPNIAACAGGWSVPGVLDERATTPQCSHKTGNSNADNPTGAGCSVADLCASTWHPCRNGQDVWDNSPSNGCEAMLSAGDQGFFLVMTGAFPTGMCFSDLAASNDLHGCGNIGEAESDLCSPLTRRMGFADCADAKDPATMKAVWNCGDSSESLQEAKIVTKNGPTFGGVLCCKNPA